MISQKKSTIIKYVPKKSDSISYSEKKEEITINTIEMDKVSKEKEKEDIIDILNDTKPIQEEKEVYNEKLYRIFESTDGILLGSIIPMPNINETITIKDRHIYIESIIKVGDTYKIISTNNILLIQQQR